MITEGVKCAKERCSGKGNCVVDQYFFDKDFKNLSYDSIFTKDACVCDVDSMGHDCSQEYDPSLQEIKESKAAKKINWTKFPLNKLRHEWFRVYNQNQQKILHVFNDNYHHWSVFPIAHYN